jgi:hypothetical protein
MGFRIVAKAKNRPRSCLQVFSFYYAKKIEEKKQTNVSTCEVVGSHQSSSSGFVYANKVFISYFWRFLT